MARTAASTAAVLLTGLIATGCSGSTLIAPSRGADTAVGPPAPAVPTSEDTAMIVDGSSVVLGSSGRSQARGLGTARPSLVDLGGADSTGVIEHLTWENWGDTTATGSGTAAYAAPGEALASATQERATVVAADQGSCDGKPAYRTLTWYFPQHGEVAGAHPPLDICGP